MSTERKIGNTPIVPVGFGAMGVGIATYGAVPPDEERFKLLDAAHANGCTHWDTANSYGDSEEIIGRWFKRTGKRDDIFLATKFGFGPMFQGISGTAEDARTHCVKSLKRLGVETIDLYYLHRVDPKVPIELTIRAMAELVKEGKVKYLGLSECSATALRRAHAVHPISAIQVEYSPFVLDIEHPKVALLKTARELGVTIVAYSPLGRGFLTGKYKTVDDFEPGDFRLYSPPDLKFAKENFPKILEIVNRVEKIAVKHNATPGQVSLAWILAQGNDFVVIPGTKKIKYLEENIKAVDVKLTSNELAELRDIAVQADQLPGDRYTPVYMAALFVDSPELKE